MVFVFSLLDSYLWIFLWYQVINGVGKDPCPLLSKGTTGIQSEMGKKEDWRGLFQIYHIRQAMCF